MYINDHQSLADVADRLVASPYRVYGSDRLRIWIVRRILTECMTASKSSKAIRISMELIPWFPMNMIFQADSSWYMLVGFYLVLPDKGLVNVEPRSIDGWAMNFESKIRFERIPQHWTRLVKIKLHTKSSRISNFLMNQQHRDILEIAFRAAHIVSTKSWFG